jgi:hypothetical protein
MLLMWHFNLSSQPLKLTGKVKIKKRTVMETMIMKIMMMMVIRLLDDQLICIRSEGEVG